MAENKIKYGICNAYYAPISTSEDGAVTYGTPVAIPGAKSISLPAKGNTNTFYADNIAYFTTTSNAGYEGDFECATIPDSFRKDILGEKADKNGLLVEFSNSKVKEFAFLFQFEGDIHGKRTCFYRCTATRPDVSGDSAEETITPQTEKIKITAMPVINTDVVKASITESTETKSVYADWFKSVKIPDFTETNPSV